MISVINQLLIAQLLPGLNVVEILLFLAVLAPIVLLIVLGVGSIFAFDIAKTIVTTINETFQQIRNVLTPPDGKWDNWQTLIWISVFSWAVSLLPRNQTIQSFIATIAWLFLIPGVYWFMNIEKLKPSSDIEINVKKGLTVHNLFLGSWITGALICLFLFGSLVNAPVSVALVCWPPISAVIASLPKFIKFGPTYAIPEKSEDRQQIILLMLSNLLLSCWFGLYFTTQNWLEQYPSILAGDLSRSAVVIDLNPQNKSAPRGVMLLEWAGDSVEGQLDGRPWSQVEQWLLDLDQQIAAIREEMFNQLPALEENKLWKFEGYVVPGTEYTLQLFAIWQGPTKDGAGYYLTRTCVISKTSGTRVPLSQASEPTSSSGIARVECGEIEGPISGRPDTSKPQVPVEPNDTAPNSVPETVPETVPEPEPDAGTKSW